MKKVGFLAIFTSVVLLIHIIPVEAKYSEAREKAKEREKQLVNEQANKVKDEKKKDLDDQKKALDPKTVTTTTKEPKGKASVDAINTARLKVLNDAKTAYDNAKAALKDAEKAYKTNITNSTKLQKFNDAKKAFEKAKIDRDLAKLG